MKRMTDEELAENNKWLEKQEGPVLPLGLHEGGVTLTVIREEIQKAITTGAYVQVRRPPPRLLCWLLAPWLRFQSPSLPVEPV